MEYASCFLRNLETYHQHANTYLVLGDFNFPFLKGGMNQENLLDKSQPSSEKLQANKLIEFANEFFLEQYIRKPTRNKNILDLVFTNDHFLIHSYQVIVNSTLSDHSTICINLALKTPKTKSEVKKNHNSSKISELNLKDADEEDWYRLNLMLNGLNWGSILEDLSPEESLHKFISILEEYCSIVFNKRKCFQEDGPEPRFKSNNKIPKSVRILMRNKGKLSKAILRTKSTKRYLEMKEKLDDIETKLKDSYVNRRENQEKLAISKMKNDARSFFTYAKKFSKTNSEVGPFLNEDGNLVADNESMVEMLKNQYESVYSTPVESMKISDPDSFFTLDDTNEELDNVTIGRDEVIEALEKLSTNAAPGPDGIPAILLKKCRHSLSEPLATIFYRIFSSGCIPDLLKTAFIIPIHKGGSRASPANFRPVSLTSHLIKTLERIVRVSLVRNLEMNNKLNPNQHGFRNRRSCLSHLLEHHDQVLSYLEEGYNVDSIYLDFSKAFDKVDIGILSHKMKALGITGKLGKWIHDFLTNRKQFILVNGDKSKPSKVKSGVPQGTVLGPILFLILINDIDDEVASKVSLFADDTRVMGPVNSEDDVETLQKDLDL